MQCPCSRFLVTDSSFFCVCNNDDDDDDNEHVSFYHLRAYMQFTDHPQSGVLYNSVMSVCICVFLSDDNFRKPWRRKFIFVHPVYLQRIRVKFVYEGHRVKLKVTLAEKVENPNFDRQ